jgi:uncharacterized membrane protein
MPWIILSLCSAVFLSLRYLYIKKWCSETPPALLIFSTRIFGALIMLPLFLFSKPDISSGFSFYGIVSVTVLVTMVATIVQIGTIQTRSISRSMPYMSFIPLFMIPWTLIFYREIPGIASLSGIVLCCIGAYILNINGKTGLFSPFKALTADSRARNMLLAAAALGLTTACDRTAIKLSSAVTYSFVWTCASAVIMGLLILKYPPSVVKAVILSRHSVIQAFLWAGSFVFQMAGVQAATHVPSGVTYVKLLTMLNILISVGIGGTMFGEGKILQSLSASLIMIAGAAVTIIFR